MPIQNRKASFDYEILDTFEAGIKLTGEEVKAVRAGQMDLRGAYVTTSVRRSRLRFASDGQAAIPPTLRFGRAGSDQKKTKTRPGLRSGNKQMGTPPCVKGVGGISPATHHTLHTALILFGATIHKYKYSSNKEYEPKRDRILLLSKREMDKIAQALQTKGLSVVPLEGYFKGNLFKLKIGIGRGKKAYDKRETIKRREIERETRKRMKG